jgi:8-amino-7-oxononanoate synthase
MFHVKQETPAALRFVDHALSDLRARGLFRERPLPSAGGAMSFCSNDYLGLASLPAPPRPSGAGASRLVSGERSEHRELEGLVASLVRLPESLAFSSGYAANVGTLAALATEGDLIVSDALNHASIIDGARLSKARIEVVPHLDVAAMKRVLEQPRSGRAFVVTESYFSMDADSPDLAALRRICDARDAGLVVDEAHALGVLGPEGRGLCAEHGVVPDALVGTFGKAFGAAGAFVAGCPSLVSFLWNRARTFVFSTGLSPAVSSAAAHAIRVASEDSRLRNRAVAAANRLRSGMTDLGIPLGGFGHIIPWIVGDPARALRIADLLRQQGMDVRAIRPPSVPEGTARLRLTVTAAHEDADIDRALACITRALRQAGPGTDGR